MATRIRCLITIIVLYTVCISCKKHNADSISNLDLPGGDHIEVEFLININRDATLKLFHTLNKDADFTQEVSITKQVKSSNTVQQIIFSLPKGVREPQLRLDVKGARNIILKKLRIKYGKRMIDVDGEEMFRYFRPDYTKCTIDLETGTITAKEGKDNYLSLYSYKEFMDHQMKLLTQE